MTDDELVRLDVAGGVALVTLNRPDRMNALTGPMTERYFDVMDSCMANRDVRVVVVTGAGRGFCVGSDVAHLDAVLADPTTASISVGARSFVDATSAPKPVIAAVNGACAGLGMVIALSCDLRFVAAGAKLTTSFAKLGLVAEQGLSWLLPRVIGTGATMDLLLSGRVVTAEEAHGLGLVNRVVERDRLLDEALGYAAGLAQGSSPSSMALIKAQVWGDQTRSLEEAVDQARNQLRAGLEGPDFAEGVAALREGRDPQFAALESTKNQNYGFR